MKANICRKNKYFDIVVHHEDYSAKTTLSIINDAVQDIWVETRYFDRLERFELYFSVFSSILRTRKK